MIFNHALATIDHISKNVTSGAAELEREAVAMFHLFINNFFQKNRTDFYLFRKQIEKLCVKLIQAQPTMAPLFNLSNSILLLSNNAKSLEYLKQNLIKYLSLNDTTKKILENAAKIISPHERLITHSRSSTVKDILIDRKRIEVICTESRPKSEGRQLAKDLSSHGIQVTVVTDAAIFAQMNNASCVLVGADAITQVGVVNKIGTMALAIAAKEYNIPFYVASSKRKIYPFQIKIREKNPNEIWDTPPSGVRIKNYYFDSTPLHQVKFFITEDGLLTGKDLKQKISSLKIAPQLLDINNSP